MVWGRLQFNGKIGRAQVLFTAGSQEKIDLVCSIGGDMGITIMRRFFDSVIKTVGNRGVDLIQDLVGVTT
ncbi:MAG: hypothetical protein CM1200mP24_07090 [Gammaproteobacteria bacterium]|nr:MAG: hypothetical protein CM1200mP24_07090 [Gammaproteobacteria bacterium]